MNDILYVIFFIISIIIASYSQILLKKGTAKKNIYINKYTIMGYLLMIISTLFTLYAYKGIPLSLSQILQSLSFIFVAVFSHILLDEKITKRIVIGTIFIFIGIIIYSI